MGLLLHKLRLGNVGRELVAALPVQFLVQEVVADRAQPFVHILMRLRRRRHVGIIVA